MFGYAAFAQPTFAGLGSNQFSVNISEAITYADVQSSLRTTFANISESIISDIDIDAVIATFSASILESLTASDSSNVNANFTYFRIRSGNKSINQSTTSRVFRPVSTDKCIYSKLLINL